MKRPRVLFWTQLFHPYIGGIEVHSARLLPALEARGYEFAVVTSHGSLRLSDEDVYAGVPVHRFPFLEALQNRDVKQMWRIQKRLTTLKRSFMPDLIHITVTDPSVFFHLHTLSAHPAPCLLSVPIAPPRLGDEVPSLLRRALNLADWVIANSNMILEEARRLSPEIAPRSSIIYPSLDAPETEPAPLPPHAPRLLCAGRVVRDKGFDVAVDALPLVLARFPGARLVIAGDGPARPELEARARERAVHHAVELLGWVRPGQMYELIQTATLVLMPSRWQEAFGLVALQAAQMARPVVATRVGGLPEVVIDGKTGLLVEKEDPRGLAEAILRLLDDPEAATVMGRAGRAAAESRFSWQSHVDAHDRLYRRLIKAK